MTKSQRVQSIKLRTAISISDTITTQYKVARSGRHLLPDRAEDWVGNLIGTQSAIAWVIALITDGLKEWQAMFNRASPRCVLYMLFLRGCMLLSCCMPICCSCLLAVTFTKKTYIITATNNAAVPLHLCTRLPLSNVDIADNVFIPAVNQAVLL